MKPLTALRRILATVLLLAGSLVLAGGAEERSPADKAWIELRKTATPPSPPREWFTTKPSDEVLSAFNKQRAAKALEASNKAREYYQQFPNDAHATEARLLEYNLLSAVVQLGDASVTPRMLALQEGLASDPAIPEEERLGMMFTHAQSGLAEIGDGDPAPALLKAKAIYLMAYERFPKRLEPAAYLLRLVDMLMAFDEVDAAHDILKRLIAEGNNEQVIAAAKEQMQSFDRLGKPVEIAFTALDGQKIDVATLKGKVVLINYWATWCPPCVKSIPDLKASYEKWHPKGLELIGISLDHAEEPLAKMVKSADIPWPQHYDRENENNRFAVKYGVNSTPTFWLLDKQGNLRFLNARVRMEEKIAKLLAEQ